MLNALDEFQRAAAETKDGAYLTLAGPGSGKTTMLLERVSQLITAGQIPPEKILLVTFTKDAATEMRLRFAARCEGRKLPVTFSTFHAFFFTILKSKYAYSREQILLGEARENLLRNTLSEILGEEANRFPYNTEDFFEDVARDLNRAKNMSAFVPDSLEPAQFTELLGNFAKEKRKRGLIDFDDMQDLCFDLLQSDAKIRAIWQDKFHYYMIDEAQDMNEVQYEIVRLLTKDRPNVFAVGDDDQSIYSFRGADPAILKRFAREYENCRVLYLKKNYRSDTSIVEMATNVIEHNQNRFAKEFLPSSAEEGAVRYQTLPDRKAEADEIVRRIVARTKIVQGENDRQKTLRKPMDTTAILVRHNYQKIPFEQALKKAHIEGVSLLTYHGAKGLEFDTVYLPDVNEGITPSGRANEKYAIEEERRMFYVAMTRAKHRLYLYSVRREENTMRYPSRFLSDMRAENRAEKPVKTRGAIVTRRLP